MSFHAIFTFDGGRPDGYEVIAARLGFAQNTDDVGRPNSEVFGSMIALRLQPVEDDGALIEWSINSFEQRNGKIQYYRNDQPSVFREVSFTNGYCTDYEVKFNPGEKQGSLLTDIYISAEATSIDGVTHKNDWSWNDGHYRKGAWEHLVPVLPFLLLY